MVQRVQPLSLSGVRVAAQAAGMTLTGFCAIAALTVAHNQPIAGSGQPGRAEWADIQRHLFAARVAVNRTGTNLNQAVAALNATGDAPVWLEYAVARCVGAVQQMDALTSRIHRRLA